MLSLALTTLTVLAVFTIVVVIHELGHFLVCRAFGVKVEVFSIGFWKELFGFDWKGTRWSFSLLPFGGYIKPKGEDIEETTGAPDEFFGQVWYKRIAIAFAGPVMNYLLAFVCFFWLLTFWGQTLPSTEPVIGEVVADFPAQAAGLQKGDRILAINGNAVAVWDDIAREIHSRPGVPVDIRFERPENGGTMERSIALVPKKDPERGVGLVGISPGVETKPMGAKEAFVDSGRQLVFWSVLTVKYLGDAVIKRRKPEVAGPVGIAVMIAKVAKQGMQELVTLIALISLSLGLFNLFPIPLLDGGHMMLYLIEGITRKPLNKSLVSTVNLVGATLLISLVVFASIQDFTRLKFDFWK